jgi:hypothetical protein
MLTHQSCDFADACIASAVHDRAPAEFTDAHVKSLPDRFALRVAAATLQQQVWVLAAARALSFVK